MPISEFSTSALHLQIMREILEHKIKIYEFPESDEEEENKLLKKIKVVVVFLPPKQRREHFIKKSVFNTYTCIAYT